MTTMARQYSEERSSLRSSSLLTHVAFSSQELPAIDLTEARAKAKGGPLTLFSNPLFWLTVTTMGAMAVVKAKK